MFLNLKSRIYSPFLKLTCLLFMNMTKYFTYILLKSKIRNRKRNKNEKIKAAGRTGQRD